MKTEERPSASEYKPRPFFERLRDAIKEEPAFVAAITVIATSAFLILGYASYLTMNMHESWVR